MGDRRREFEEEWERRRNEEGEHFDEEAYQHARGMMDRRMALEQRRMDAEEAYQRDRQELDSRGGPPQAKQREREELDRKHQEMMEQIDADHRALDQEQNEYHLNRQRGEELSVGDYLEEIDMESVREAVDEMSTRFAGTRDLFRALEKSVEEEIAGECEGCVGETMQRLEKYAEMRGMDRYEKEELIGVAMRFVDALPANNE